MRSASAARFRGIAVAICSATVTLAAHTAGGGALCSGAALALLLIGSGTVGALAALNPGPPRFTSLLGWLLAAQAVGHLSLGLGDHTHPFGAAMLLAHLGAAVFGAALLVLAEHLWQVIGSVLVGLNLLAAHPSPTSGPRPPAYPVLSWLTLLGSGTGNRGPPVVASGV